MLVYPRIPRVIQGSNLGWSILERFGKQQALLGEPKFVNPPYLGVVQFGDTMTLSYPDGFQVLQ
jgi:hypothetical protein